MRPLSPLLALLLLPSSLSLVPLLTLPACAEAKEPILAAGDVAPSFTLLDGGGASVSLASLLAKGPVVIFFYPKNFTPGCTKEACAYRDRTPELAAAGAQVVGISMDSVESHRKFKEEHKLTFPTLADADGAVSRSYGTAQAGSPWASRWTFVIGRDGKVARTLPNVDPVAHLDEVLAVVKGLK